jgi:hypothetical protein
LGGTVIFVRNVPAVTVTIAGRPAGTFAAAFGVLEEFGIIRWRWESSSGLVDIIIIG